MPPKKDTLAFKFQEEKAHFTYASHVDPVKIRALMKTFGAFKMYSFVHELGDKEEDVGYPEGHEGPYAHTHVFVWWEKCLDVTNARAWDLGAIHPHMQPTKGMMWAKDVVMKYHLGHKTKANSKKYYIKPELLIQEGVEDWDWVPGFYEICLSAPTSIDAAKMLDIKVPKKNGEKNLSRKQGKTNDFAVPEPCCSLELMKPREEIIATGWNPQEQVLILRGSSGRGKTNWALSQGKKVHLISSIDDLKRVRDDCDLLVFDGMLFGEGKLLQDISGMIALTDHKFERSLYARNKNVTMPTIPRIFCVNEFESVFGDDPRLGGHYSVQRRVFDFNIHEVWGMCYYKGEMKDGVMTAVVPSNTAEDERLAKRQKCAVASPSNSPCTEGCCYEGYI